MGLQYHPRVLGFNRIMEIVDGPVRHFLKCFLFCFCYKHFYPQSPYRRAPRRFARAGLSERAPRQCLSAMSYRGLLISREGCA